MRALLAGAGGLLCLFVLACGGSSPPPEPTLAPPPIDPRLRVLQAGSLTLAVEGAASQALDPAAIARGAGLSQPCEGLTFLFVWRVQEKREVEVRGRQDGRSIAIGSGREGQASVGGCMLLEAVNPGKSALTVDVRYYVAEVRP